MALTKRQKWLLDYVKRQNKQDPSRWVSAREIVDAMNCDLSYCEGDNYRMSGNPKSHNPCPAIWSDKEAINADPSVDEPIMYSNYELKIPCSVEELEEFYTSDLMKRAKKMLWRLGVAKRKAKKNGQMKVEFGPDGKVTESFIRSLIAEACDAVKKEVEASSDGEATHLSNNEGGGNEKWVNTN